MCWAFRHRRPARGRIRGPPKYVKELNDTIRDDAPVDVLLRLPETGNVFKGNKCTIGVPET